MLCVAVSRFGPGANARSVPIRPSNHRLLAHQEIAMFEAVSRRPLPHKNRRIPCIGFLRFQMTKSIDRRAFLQRAAALSVALPNLRMPARRAPLILRVALIDSGDGAAARRLGAAMGVNEAKRSAALFGGDIVLTVVS